MESKIIGKCLCCGYTYSQPAEKEHSCVWYLKGQITKMTNEVNAHVNTIRKLEYRIKNQHQAIATLTEIETEWECMAITNLGTDTPNETASAISEIKRGVKWHA